MRLKAKDIIAQPAPVKRGLPLPVYLTRPKGSDFTWSQKRLTIELLEAHSLAKKGANQCIFQLQVFADTQPSAYLIQTPPQSVSGTLKLKNLQVNMPAPPSDLRVDLAANCNNQGYGHLRSLTVTFPPHSHQGLRYCDENEPLLESLWIDKACLAQRNVLVKDLTYDVAPYCIRKKITRKKACL